MRSLKERLENTKNEEIMQDANLWIMGVSSLIFGIIWGLVCFGMLVGMFASEKWWTNGTFMILAVLFGMMSLSKFRLWWRGRGVYPKFFERKDYGFSNVKGDYRRVVVREKKVKGK